VRAERGRKGESRPDEEPPRTPRAYAYGRSKRSTMPMTIPMNKSPSTSPAGLLQEGETRGIPQSERTSVHIENGMMLSSITLRSISEPAAPMMHDSLVKGRSRQSGPAKPRCRHNMDATWTDPGPPGKNRKAHWARTRNKGQSGGETLTRNKKTNPLLLGYVALSQDCCWKEWPTTSFTVGAPHIADRQNGCEIDDFFSERLVAGTSWRREFEERIVGSF